MIVVGMVMIGMVMSGVLMILVRMIFRRMILDAVAIVVVILVRRGFGGVDAVHRLTDFEDRLGAVRFLGEDEPLAVFGEQGGIDWGFAAAQEK